MELRAARGRRLLGSDQIRWSHASNARISSLVVTCEREIWITQEHSWVMIIPKSCPTASGDASALRESSSRTVLLHSSLMGRSRTISPVTIFFCFEQRILQSLSQRTDVYSTAVTNVSSGCIFWRSSFRRNVFTRWILVGPSLRIVRCVDMG